MDLLKMDPMARKMEEHQKAFLSALTSGNANLAKQHLNEVRKVADFLSEDISAAIAKADSDLSVGPNDIFAGGVPVLKFGNRPTSSQSLSGSRLPGSISNGVRPSQFTRVTGTFGRYSN
jgi:hypothetical protein|tara:strand:+ start:29 stop:385 length:357 start_codon:yes stop_codon:yes gene_type:complete